MSKTKRVGLSKGTRFRIFNRDGFTCRYCGRQSDTIALVVDHVIPVAAGGTNDDENLVTSCEDCNQGKAAKPLTSTPIDSEDTRLRLAQEMQEQRRAAEAARAAVEHRAEFRQSVVNLWCDIRGTTDIEKTSLDIMTSFARKYGIDVVAEWISIAAERLYRSDSDYKFCKYVCGIRRNLIAEGKLLEDGPLPPPPPPPPPAVDDDLEWAFRSPEEREFRDALARNDSNDFSDFYDAGESSPADDAYPWCDPSLGMGDLCL